MILYGLDDKVKDVNHFCHLEDHQCFRCLFVSGFCPGFFEKGACGTYPVY